MKKKIYQIKHTVWEYYEVKAYSRREALAQPNDDPYRVEYRNKRIVKDDVY